MLRWAADVLTLEGEQQRSGLHNLHRTHFSRPSVVSLPTPAYCSVVTWCSDARCTTAPRSGPKGSSVHTPRKCPCAGLTATKPTLESSRNRAPFHMQIPLTSQSQCSVEPRELFTSEGARYCFSHGPQIESVELKEVVGERAAVRA
jgi:hypothetical protein